MEKKIITQFNYVHSKVIQKLKFCCSENFFLKFREMIYLNIR